MTILIETIKKLRQETRAGVQDCRKALEEVNGDYAGALAFLRAKAAADAARRANHTASQGLLEAYTHGSGRIGVMVEVNTETDFAGRSETFRSFAHEVALQIAAAAPDYVRDEEIPAAVLEAETLKVAARARQEGKPEAILPRIIAGYLEKFKNQKVLLRQAYIRDDKMIMAQLLSQAAASVGENIVIRRFVRWELNDGISE